MAFYKILQFFTTSFHLLLLLSVNHAFSQEETPINGSNSIPTCSDYSGNNKHRFIVIPTSRTNRIMNNSLGGLQEKPIRFQLEAGFKLKCAEKTAEIRTISLEMELDASKLVGRNFQTVRTGSTEAHSHSYFTSSGYFYDNMTNSYYKPDGDYCIQSNTTKDVTLKVCAVDDTCSGPSASKNVWCLPKCCAIDEVLLLFQRKCVRLIETDGATPWIPPIYKGPKNPNKKLDGVDKNIIFRMAAALPKNCNVKILKNGSQTNPFYKLVSASTAKHPKRDEVQSKDNLKLAGPVDGKSGKIQPMELYYRNRSWMLESWDDYCVEGFYVKSEDTPKYTGKEDDFVVFYCNTEKQEDESTTVAISSFYVVTSLFALFFLLLTTVVYVLIWDKHNLHGLTILSYVVATFASYLFLASAHLISLFPNPEITGLHTRGPLCYGIAVLAHFFFLASYLCLTILNFDLWLNLSSLRTTRRESKEWKRFGIYSLITWILPLLLIIAFITVDIVYRDPATEVPVPDYAVSTCFVSPDFRGPYVYIPMAILLVVNIALILMTMSIFIRARWNMTMTFSEGASNANRYSLKLYLKLFFIMGGTSLVDFLTWYYNNSGKPWVIVLLESITYLTPVVLFILFCLNDRVISQMRDKYPVFMATLDPVLAIFVRGDRRTETTMNHSTTSNKTSYTTTDTLQKGNENVPIKMRSIEN